MRKLFDGWCALWLVVSDEFAGDPIPSKPTGVNKGMANIRSLRKSLNEQGWDVDQTSQGHWKATPPDPENAVVHFSDSDDPHAFRNIIAELRRKGFKWPWKKPKVKAFGDRPSEPQAVRPTDELLQELTEARDYYYLAVDHADEMAEAQRLAMEASSQAYDELETSKRALRKAKAAFDQAFELPDIGEDPKPPPKSEPNGLGDFDPNMDNLSK